MNRPFLVPELCAWLPRRCVSALGSLLAAMLVALGQPAAAQTGQPLPGPTLVITPGVLSTAEAEAYNAARTPQVTVTLNLTLSTPTVLRLGSQDGTRAAVT